MYRKCYIDLKVVSISCYGNGDIPSSYAPRETHHPFDTAVPQTGDNMFEDIHLNVAEPYHEAELKGRTVKVIEIPSSSITEDETWTSGDVGANVAQLAVLDEEQREGAQTKPARSTTSATGIGSTRQPFASTRTFARATAVTPAACNFNQLKPADTPQLAGKRKRPVVNDSEDELDNSECEPVQPRKPKQPTLSTHAAKYKTCKDK